MSGKTHCRVAAGACALQGLRSPGHAHSLTRPSILFCVLQSLLVSVSEFPRADAAAFPHTSSSLHAYLSACYLNHSRHYNDGRH